MSEQQAEYLFRLYSANRHDEMQAVIEDFRQVFEKHFPGCCRFELIDVLSEPERATQDEVFVTPTLIKTQPEPIQRIIGDLTEPNEVLAILGVIKRESKSS